MRPLDARTGCLALGELIREGSLLRPLSLLYRCVGRVFQIPLPAFHPYVVGGPEANRKVLVSERNKLRWRNLDPVADVLRHGILIRDGEEHDHHRSLMEAHLHPSVLSDYAGIMITETDRVAALWQDGQVVDMLVEGRKIALLIILRTLFGVDAWADLAQIWTPLLKTIEYISPGPWILWRRMPRPGFRKQLKALDDYAYGIIRARRAGRPQPDLLQHLIDAGLDDERIRDQMLTMLIAGHDTSTALLAWTFYLLGSHPEIYARVVTDLRTALGTEPPGLSSGWQPPLLDQVIKESLRLYPPIHVGNRTVAEDMEVHGERIPAGERLFYSIYLTHRDPAYWQNPDDFCPARFAHGGKAPPFAYVPFGGGPRACIGAAFGQMEARLVLGRLLQCHDFKLVEPKVHPHMGATLEPRPGVRMQVRRRLIE